MEQRIKGTTGLLALIGSPVGHSGSPDMYNFCFRYHNLDYCYMAFDIKEDQVPAALDAMRLFNMRGCNVTMPCKTAAAQNMDELSAAARIIGAVNTIVNENGKLVGHMTDGIGFVENLRDHGVDVKGKKMVVLGAGGAATAIQVQCALDGAASISIFNPNDPFLDRAKNTAAKLKKEVPDCDVQVFCIEDQDKLKEEIAKADILVNGTLAGMKPHEDVSLITDKSVFRPDLVVCDVVYNPEETRLLREAREAGCAKTIGGKGMLLWQGVAAYKLYTGLDMPVEEYKKFHAENATYNEVKNETEQPWICLIGGFVIGYAGAGGVLQLATSTTATFFPENKGTATSMVMIASSIANYTIISLASYITKTGGAAAPRMILLLNMGVTIVGILLALYVKRNKK